MRVSLSGPSRIPVTRLDFGPPPGLPRPFAIQESALQLLRDAGIVRGTAVKVSMCAIRMGRPRPRQVGANSEQRRVGESLIVADMRHEATPDFDKMDLSLSRGVKVLDRLSSKVVAMRPGSKVGPRSRHGSRYSHGIKGIHRVITGRTRCANQQDICWFENIFSRP